MSDIQRFRRADAKAMRRHAVASGQVIEVGDMVWVDPSNDDVRPASSFSYVSSNLTHTQANFKRDFAGIAQEASDDGDTKDIAVASRGVYEMDIASASVEPGELLGPDDNSGGDTLLDQQVIGLGEGGYGGIMRVVEVVSSGTRVLAEILPLAMRFPQDVQMLTFGPFPTSTAQDLVTDYTAQFPFSIKRFETIQVTNPDSDAVITLDKGSDSIDDTVTVTAAGSVGLVEGGDVDDSNDRHHFDAGDTLTIKSDGGSTSGEVIVVLTIQPYLHERA